MVNKQICFIIDVISIHDYHSGQIENCSSEKYFDTYISYCILSLLILLCSGLKAFFYLKSFKIITRLFLHTIVYPSVTTSFLVFVDFVHEFISHIRFIIINLLDCI